MTPPPYIPLIQDGWIRIQGDHARIPALKTILVDIPFGYSGVCFVEGGSYFKNISLIQALMDLNDLGVAFGEDYTQMWSPAGFMRELQTEFILKKPFTSIYWNGADNWNLKTNKTELAGAVNPHACGTSVMPPAFSASRAGVTPEASGDS